MICQLTVLYCSCQLNNNIIATACNKHAHVLSCRRKRHMITNSGAPVIPSHDRSEVQKDVRQNSLQNKKRN